jgi:hypothetical protein
MGIINLEIRFRPIIPIHQTKSGPSDYLPSGAGKLNLGNAVTKYDYLVSLAIQIYLIAPK